MTLVMSPLLSRNAFKFSAKKCNGQAQSCILNEKIPVFPASIEVLDADFLGQAEE